MKVDCELGEKLTFTRNWEENTVIIEVDRKLFNQVCNELKIFNCNKAHNAIMEIVRQWNLYKFLSLMATAGPTNEWAFEDGSTQQYVYGLGEIEE